MPESEKVRSNSRSSGSDTSVQLPEVERTPPPLMLLGIAVPLSLLLAVAGLFLFGWIAEEAMEQHTMRLDLAVRNWVHQHSSPAMTHAATSRFWGRYSCYHCSFSHCCAGGEQPFG